MGKDELFAFLSHYNINHQIKVDWSCAYEGLLNDGEWLMYINCTIKIPLNQSELCILYDGDLGLDIMCKCQYNTESLFPGGKKTGVCFSMN